MIKETVGLWSVIKTHAIEFISLAFIWLAPIHGLVLFILLAIGVDTWLGRRCARITAIREGKDPRLAVTSKKTRHGVLSKVASYVGVLILTLFLDRVMLNDLLLYFLPTLPIKFLITKGLGIIFLLIELDSCDESYYKISGKRIKESIKNKITAVKNMLLGAKKFKDEIVEDKQD
jgi:hypothetical protein